jgi:hypothetical protein
MTDSKLRVGTIDRWPYFWQGTLLLALKYNLDRAVARWGFHRSWYFWNYLEPHRSAAVDAVPPQEWSFYLILLLTSLPFLAVGILLTLRRLRSAGLPLALCLLFFVPVANLVFFVALSVISKRSFATGRDENLGRYDRWLPRSEVGSALASTLIVGTIGIALAEFGTNVLQNYGWGLFVALPFTIGLVSVLIYAGREQRSVASCMLVAILPLLFIGCGLLALAAEGAICLFMAAPIGIVLAMLGGLVGLAIVNRRNRGLPHPGLALIFLSLPLLMGMEKRADLQPALLCVKTAVVIDAAPEVVWSNMIAFPPIPPARDWVLRTGIAYPTRAEILGHGVGAIRHCIFSTGQFVEPIEVWDEPKLLKFSVAAQPEPLEELSPYPRINAPHLHGYLQSREGQLQLTALPGGKTLLEGKTWYTDQMWPSAYWQLWSDWIIHHIHLRVLNHIKAISEAQYHKFS